MIIKTGVLLWDMHPRVECIFHDLDKVTNRLFGRDVILTAGREGLHSKNSLHYEGRAIDIRINDLDPDRIQEYASEIRKVLGPGYDVVVEGTHIHIEWDRRND
jgi:hypothetical protein